ncbi:unnamed protein product [Prorocentrum cordatum]|uniref:Uncharacterized protein n=1 Tax=Prorocentrum cordatum TaxID=2364126 RepID=A0ABN9SCI4_9DINO|nr:unnamed protein product [Polarella glacialis]
MAAAQAVAGPRAWCRVAGTHVHLGFQAPCGPGKPGLPLSSGCCSPCLGGLACESERPTALPLSYCGGAAPDRLSFQKDASERISCGSMAWGAPQLEPPGRWTFGSEVGTAELMGGGEDGPSDGEDDDADGGDEGFPSKILVYPSTDDEGEGEPQLKAAWELWPRRAPPPRRRLAHAPAALAPAALPGPGARAGAILGTLPRETRQAAPPRRPLGIHAPVAAPAATGGAPPLRVPRVSAAAAAATGAAVASAPTHREAQDQEVAHEGGASRRDRRESRPQITSWWCATCTSARLSRSSSTRSTAVASWTSTISHTSQGASKTAPGKATAS